MKRNVCRGAGILVLIAGVAGCSSDKNDEESITAGPENKEPPTFGSATDILSTNNERELNSADKADIGVGGPQRGLGNYEVQPLEGQQSDRELEKQIRVALTTGSLGTTGVMAEDTLTTIQVKSENGAITLTGPVSSAEEKRVITERVSGMEGVRSVRNQLTVRPGIKDNIPLDPRVPRSPEREAL